MKENIVAFLITEIYVSYCLHFNSPGIRRGCSMIHEQPRLKYLQIALNNSEQLLNFKHIVSSSLFEMYLYQLTKEL